jgi:cytosine/adenosine deaminase-related metal-dependent hydrolase
MAIYLENCTFIDWKKLTFKITNIKVEEENPEILFLDRLPEIGSDDIVIDCYKKIVTKSFACGHHHVYSALSRGMPAAENIPSNFYEILKYIWWKLDKCLDLEIIKASALVTAIYCAKNGVTFVIDHHSSPNAIENSLFTIAEAFEKVGVSHLLCYEISDRDGLESKKEGLNETENYLKKKKTGLVGLHASFTVGNDLLKKAVSLCEKYDSGIHIHTAEDIFDQEDCLQKYNKRVIDRFNEFGVLNFDKTILAHCLHIDDKERAILKNSKAYIVENIDSNLNNGVGYFSSMGLNDNIMLGTDGMYSDMLKSMKSAYFVGQRIEQVNIKTIYDRFRKVHEYISKNGFSGDADNNLVIVNYDSPTDVNEDNFLGHLIFGIDSTHIDSVISSGKLIVRDKKILTVDEEDVLRFSKEMGYRLWKKMKELSV